MNSLSFCLSWETFIPTSFLKDSLLTLVKLGSKVFFFPFTTLNMSFHSSPKISAEKSVVSLMGVSINVTWHLFSLKFLEIPFVLNFWQFNDDTPRVSPSLVNLPRLFESPGLGCPNLSQDLRGFQLLFC